ncbi:hypothetical protein [Cupriavidus sp. IDO]|uniref:hypothetical protein n=1 Tax=Cupriavidus sp. IDO TaxID=1539142 RepID=UPI00057918E0|nr:hypothetical protein [Cupriavidus sp. IDO]KWR83377.1 hypothetical protein RM96_28355 [Cupriavidus sp. IDO]
MPITGCASVNPDCPAILFVAIDRHNFGGLLLAQVMGRLLANRRLVYAGLADRDLKGAIGRKRSRDWPLLSRTSRSTSSTWTARSRPRLDLSLLPRGRFLFGALFADLGRVPAAKLGRP